MTLADNSTELSVLEVFRLEVKAQTVLLYEELQALEQQPSSISILESLLRIVHTLRSAARLVDLEVAVSLTHTLHQVLTTSAQQALPLTHLQIATLRQGVDGLYKISCIDETELADWVVRHQVSTQRLQDQMLSLFSAQDTPSDHLGLENSLPVGSGATGVDFPPPPSTPANCLTTSPEEVITLPRELPQPLLADRSMLELFRLEIEAQVMTLNEGLLTLEHQPQSPQALESLMRAAHSIKGASRIVAIETAVRLAHCMEDCFVAAQNHRVILSSHHIDVLLRGADWLMHLGRVADGELSQWLVASQGAVTQIIQEIVAILNPKLALSPPGVLPSLPKTSLTTTHGAFSDSFALPSPSEAALSALATTPTTSKVTSREEVRRESSNPAIARHETTSHKGISHEIVSHEIVRDENASHRTAIADQERVVRVSADNLNRIMGLAGESLIAANWLQPYADSLMLLKKRQVELAKLLDQIQGAIATRNHTDSEKYLEALRQKEVECREMLLERMNELELFVRRSTNLSDRLYREVIASQMRPFADGIQSFPRMVRDLSRQLNKQAQLEVIGQTTPVDRDILKKLEAPLTHILRNAIDHGLETPEERQSAGKPAVGKLRLEAAHRGGMLAITIADDGQGINLENLRQKIVAQGLSTDEVTREMTDDELLEFLFLPGLSTRQQVTEISGRGVGLNIAQSMAQEVGGTVQVTTQLGKGTQFHFRLPLTLSVVRTLLVEISQEPYAFPLARIEQIVMVTATDIHLMENRQYFRRNDRHIGLVPAYQVLGLPEVQPRSPELPVIVIRDESQDYGLVVDRVIGEYDLVVRSLDPRLGKVKDISAAALLSDGSPVLIMDVADLVRSISNQLNGPRLQHLTPGNETGKTQSDRRKSILVVDDSITVREMERKMLQNRGYRVDVAVDGMEGWHAVCTNPYDLVISDIDMPRMNGIELVTKIKSHQPLSHIPVIIMSYKNRPEDREKGLAVGADYYLTKSSFHDNTLVEAVSDLIGD